MMLSEYATHQASPNPIQVFANDIDERAIAVAREGRYLETISADVSPARLRRFFVAEPGHYRVQNFLRDIVIFAHQNLLRDPPISRLDLISCRNVLIYLTPDAQMRLLRVLHYALRPGGYLFLGAYDTADDQAGLFAPIDKQHGLFVRRDVTAQLPLDILAAPTSTR
jgi:two-component system CheB/CheR fusion protein